MFPYPRTPGYDTRTLIARPAIVQTDIDRQSRIDGDGNRRLIFRYHLSDNHDDNNLNTNYAQPFVRLPRLCSPTLNLRLELDASEA